MENNLPGNDNRTKHRIRKTIRRLGLQLEVRVMTSLEWTFAGSAGVSPACVKNSFDIDS
jgi:hypothetical protein